MSRSFRLLTEYREPSPSMDVSSTATEYRVLRIEYRHRVSRTEYRVLRVSSTVTEYGSIEYGHRVSSTEYRVLTEYREPSPSIEYRHRVSSTITEYRSTVTEYGSIEYHHRVEYRVPSTEYHHRREPSPSMEVSSIEYRTPRGALPRVEYGHRESSTEYRVLTEYREPSPSIEVWSTVSHRGSSTVTEWRVPSTEYRVTNIETRINMSSSRITENGVPSNEQQTISANIASIVRSSVQSDSNLETRKNV